MRNEKKFIISPCQFSDLKLLLLSQGFRECYPSRKIASLYYDTNDLELFYASEDGLSKRKKIRVRWYNDQISSSKVEYKIKCSELGYKNFKELSDFKKNQLSPIYFHNKEKQINKNLLPKYIDVFYSPKTLISYHRNYYLKDNLRITYDSQILSYAVINNFNKIKILHYIPYPLSILEFKFDKDLELILKTQYKLADKLGLIQTRFSKYSNAISSLYL